MMFFQDLGKSGFAADPRKFETAKLPFTKLGGSHVKILPARPTGFAIIK